MTARTRFYLEISPGESFAVGDSIVTLEKKSGQRARLLVQAHAGITITKPSAQECAPSPEKEPSYGQYPV